MTEIIITPEQRTEDEYSYWIYECAQAVEARFLESISDPNLQRFAFVAHFVQEDFDHRLLHALFRGRLVVQSEKYDYYCLEEPEAPDSQSIVVLSEHNALIKLTCRYDNGKPYAYNYGVVPKELACLS